MKEKRKERKVIIEIKGKLRQDDDNVYLDIPDLSSAKHIKFKVVEC